MSPDAARSPTVGADASGPGASAACRGGSCPLARWRVQAGAPPPARPESEPPRHMRPPRTPRGVWGRPVCRGSDGSRLGRRGHPGRLGREGRRTPGGSVVVLRGRPARPGGGAWRRRPNAWGEAETSPGRAIRERRAIPLSRAVGAGSRSPGNPRPRVAATRSTHRPAVAGHAVHAVPKPAAAAWAGHATARPPAGTGGDGPEMRAPAPWTARRILWETRKWRRNIVPRGAVRPILDRAARLVRFTPGPGGLPPRHPRAHASPQNTGPRNPR